MSSPAKSFGTWSGVGLVIANMVGAGVFLSSGFMAQNMRPGFILLAWAVGAGLAMCGTVAYAEVARLVPRGGGEYRYLSTLLHPALGYLAGWASLLVGFSAPIAIDALAAGAFAHAVVPSLEPRLVGAGVLVVLTFVHAFGLHLSTRVQNSLVAVKVGLLVVFIAVCVVKGSLAWPTWQPPTSSETPWGDLLGSLFFIAFAFSGWNAAIYASDEFKDPARDVPRAMLVGCLAVGGLYLMVNYVFVANLTPAESTVVFHYGDFASGKADFQQVTLGQAVMARLLGPGAAQVMSGVMVLLFISAMSAMMLVGPRVYAAMAADGFLPAALKPKSGRPPTFAVVLQGLLAFVLLVVQDLREVLNDIGAILVLFAALTVAGLFKARLTATAPAERPSVVSLAAASVYVVSAGFMLFRGLQNRTLLGWIAGVAVVALIAWALTRKREAAVTR